MHDNAALLITAATGQLSNNKVLMRFAEKTSYCISEATH